MWAPDILPLLFWYHKISQNLEIPSPSHPKKNKAKFSLKIRIIIEKAKEPNTIKNWVSRTSALIYLIEKTKIKVVTRNKRATNPILTGSKIILQSPNTPINLEALKIKCLFKLNNKLKAQIKEILQDININT